MITNTRGYLTINPLDLPTEIQEELDLPHPGRDCIVHGYIVWPDQYPKLYNWLKENDKELYIPYLLEWSW